MQKESYLTTKQLPKTEQPYEKCERYGAARLTDAELLAVIIRSGTKKHRSIDLAYDVLNFSDSKPGLLALYDCSMEELQQIKGIGKVKAIQLLCIAELSKRMSRRCSGSKVQFCSPKEVADYYMQEMRCLTKEQVQVIFLDGKSRMLKEKTMSIGTVNASLVSPREIFLDALKCGATGIILLHNHPSGDPTPSQEDFRTTERVNEAGRLIGIKLMDHIIIGDNQYISLKEIKFF